ncbi:MAG: ABC transporter ATP-binding protein/permease [Anaerolineae bacterium]|nr:ABC transporter ATP-binding protein/permease [Anaerolineae bacterium]
MNHLRKLLHFVKPYRVQSILSLVLLTVMALLDLSIPRLIQHIIDQGIKQNDLSVVIQTSAWMLSISVLSTLAAIGNNVYSIQVGEGTARDIREALFTKIQDFSYGNLDRFTTGKLMVRLSSDTTAIQRLFQVSLRIGTRGPLLMIGSVILMFNTSPHLAISIFPLLLVTAGVIIFFSIKMEPFYRSVQQKLDRLNTVLQENIAGARLVKAFVRADYEAERFEVANEDFTERNVQVMQFMSSMTPILTLFVNIGIVLVIWLGGLQSISGDLSLGQIVAFTNYLLTTMTPLLLMTMLSNVWANGTASAQRVNEVFETMPEVPVNPQARVLPSQNAMQVEFKDVSFHYNGKSNRLVLEHINLKAEPGSTVAILGATGAGKSSLINLIPHFYEASQGQVLIDGIDIRDIQDESLLEQIGIVPQESILFSGTVRENICYGRPEAGDDEVIAAAKAAQAHDFIIKFSEGYNSHVEERGANLSGGQKQRLAIARAILPHPRLLILDDSTSAVDVETETKIQTALQENLKDCTRFVVAQRISTVLNADKIIVLDHGKIAAEGTHSELMKFSPIYREIYESQLGNGIQA